MPAETTEPAATVAVVDYRNLAAASELCHSLRMTGFAVLVNHPLSVDLVSDVQAEWLGFFGGDAKWAYRPGPGAQDGYHPLTAGETALGAATPDLKEFFHWYPWGQHPAEVSDAAGRLHHDTVALGAELLGWLDDATPPSVSQRFAMPLRRMLDGSRRSLLRIVHYPPVDGGEPAGSLRAAAHEDINLLTVLPAATRPGLQVKDRAGAWHDVDCDPGAVVVNSGDMLQAASGGYYPSTTHRVVLPDVEAARQPRMSTPLFLQPADDVWIADDLTAFAFLRQRIREIRGRGPHRLIASTTDLNDRSTSTTD